MQYVPVDASETRDSWIRDAIERIMIENERTGIIDSELDAFFRKCFNARLADPFIFSVLDSERQKPVLDAATSLFDGLYDRICDVLEQEAIAQAEEELRRRNNEDVCSRLMD